MGEEEVAVAESPAPSDHKRKLEDLEPEAPEPTVSSPPPVETEADENANANADANSKSNLNDVKNAIQNAEDVAADGSNPSEAKRPRLEEETDGLAVENGQQEEKLDEPEKEASQQTIEENLHTEGAHQAPVETSQTMNNEPLPMDNHETENTELSPAKIPQDGNTQDLSGGDNQQVVTESIALQSNISSPPQNPMTDGQTVSRKMEVPNNKVGVLIGKAGDTIRFLQYNSGAKIQITRDADADPYSSTRPVELIGTLENINKAEKLIKDVIAEADAGGSPSLVARGFVTAQTGGDAEQIQIQVPNEKVGLIIGKGGETIKNLQTRSGARIQVLIPQHLPEGDQSKERTVRVTGNKKQIEMAKEMIKEVMNQPVRSSPLSGVYNPQTYRTRGPSGPPQWGPRGPPHVQPTGYEYHQRGAYASQSPQFPPATYGGYPSQQAPRGSFNAGWDQRPPASGQVAHHGGGYDYYGHGGGHMADASTPASGSTPAPAPLGAPASAVGPPPTQVNYNYGQPQGQDYGLPASATYSQSMPSQQHGYGHVYDEPKYENQVPMQHGYGAHGNPPPVAYQQQVNTQPGYAQQAYGKPPTYGMPSQGPPPQQSYVPPRAGQPDVPYQGPVSSTPSYGPTAASQQTYPYPTSGPMQHTYPYGTAQPSNDGYNQAPPANTSANAYAQQVGPAVPGYGQSAGQTAPGYGQGGAAGGYGQYPSSQPAYNEQSVPNSAVYGYQGPTDAAYNTAPGAAYAVQSSGQSVYVQPTPNQPGYDQPVPQTGGYGGVPGSAPGLYGKGVSPQPGYAQYDSTQMYGGHH